MHVRFVEASPANIIPSVFSTSEVQHMATCTYQRRRGSNSSDECTVLHSLAGSISEGGSTKDVLGGDYLGSMLKMENDDYADGQQPDLLKMCRSR